LTIWNCILSAELTKTHSLIDGRYDHWRYLFKKCKKKL